jgi:hypothetical protein
VIGQYEGGLRTLLHFDVGTRHCRGLGASVRLRKASWWRVKREERLCFRFQVSGVFPESS